MTEPPLQTPVILIIFNRPDTTRRVIDAIRTARPRRLLVVGDGPRADRPDEGRRCAAARACLEAIDWPCEISTDLAAVNLGCRRRVSSGLSWAFREVDEAIVLEDDCVPDPTFFPYCQELLRRYRHDPRVMLISGSDFLRGQQAEPHSYRFSRYPLIWGWATWRRAWQHYDVDIQAWPDLCRQGWLDTFLDRPAAQYWARLFQQVHDGLDTWDYSLVLSCWRHDGLCIQPRGNLVSNIGFGAGATHTHDATSVLANLPVAPLSFPLVHPDRIERAVEADRRVEEVVFSGSLARSFSTIRALMRGQPLKAPEAPGARLPDGRASPR